MIWSGEINTEHLKVFEVLGQQFIETVERGDPKDCQKTENTLQEVTVSFFEAMTEVKTET